MATIFKLILALGLFVGILTEKSHLKELDSEDNENTFLNLFNNEEIQTKNERYARHIQAITENVLDHLVNEIRYEYFRNNYHSNSPLRKLILKLNNEMERQNRNKLIKDNRKKKMANKKKAPNKKKIKWVKKNKKTPKKQQTKFNEKLIDKKRSSSAEISVSIFSNKTRIM